MITNFRSAYVAIIGLPNAGKSTLLNYLIGKDLAIISNKPQTTRNQILGIYNTNEYQLLFLDTPGFYNGRTKMDSFLKSEIEKSLYDCDIVLLIIDGKSFNLEKNKALLEIISKSTKAPVILAVNKVDILNEYQLIPLLTPLDNEFRLVSEIVPISAKSGQNIDNLLKCIEKHIKEGPQFYPEDQITDKPKEFIIAEFVRESLFRQTDEEVPFSTGVAVKEIIETGNKIVASLIIFVEKEGQKAIIIGENGNRLKAAIKHASIRARRYFSKKVEISLWVKVKAGWRQNSSILKQIGLV